MTILKVLAVVFLVIGFGTVFVAKSIVGRYGLDENAKIEFENEMTEEEAKKYKFDKATVNVKMIGLLAAIPGLVLVLIAFK